jgi:hypothetical protein
MSKKVASADKGGAKDIAYLLYPNSPEVWSRRTPCVGLWGDDPSGPPDVLYTDHWGIAGALCTDLGIAGALCTDRWAAAGALCTDDWGEPEKRYSEQSGPDDNGLVYSDRSDSDEILQSDISGSADFLCT